MGGRVASWHHGLVARWWAECVGPDPAELAFYRALVAAGQPALDLGCGAGRLLLPLLRAGLDADGCDASADMLAHCRAAAAREGFAPTLFAQPMHALAPPRRYRTVFACDAFGLGGDRAADAAALRRCRACLLPGGTLAFSAEPPWADAARWRYWLPGERGGLPEPWPDAGARRRLAGGDELELRVRLAGFDPLAQRAARQVRATLYRDGAVVAEEERGLLETLYFPHELVLMLEAAGFAGTEVLGGYAGEPPDAAAATLVYVARA